MPSVRGSDHCPVYIDLHEEITDSKGNVRKLRDEIHMSGEKTRTASFMCSVLARVLWEAAIAV